MLIVIFALFFFNDTATTEIYTLSLHDALPIWPVAIHQRGDIGHDPVEVAVLAPVLHGGGPGQAPVKNRRKNGDFRSEEHTSELQSQSNLVCRLLLEKKKKNTSKIY